MSILFKDLAKKANDLLSNRKKYTTGGTKKFSLKTKAANGVTYKAEASLAGGSVKGKIGTEMKLDSGFTIKKLELDNKGCLGSEITLDKAVDNVQFTLNVKLEPLNSENPKEESKVGAILTNKDFKADVIVSPMEPTTLDTSICCRKDGYFFGGSAGIKLDDSGCNVDVSGYDFGVGYSTAKSTAAFTVTNKLGNYQFSFYTQHSDAIAFAATLGGKTSTASKPTGALEFGGSYKVDGDTTAYSKLSIPDCQAASATASFNLDTALNCNTKLGLTSVMPLDFNSAPQFGLNLAFGM